MLIIGGIFVNKPVLRLGPHLGVACGLKADRNSIDLAVQLSNAGYKPDKGSGDEDVSRAQKPQVLRFTFEVFAA
ncbi:uncharacterized protein GLRG_09082 [Colletotrichum graminicola M1.001]|uniref:Uncharacterized protein n=1 Tax=Colletotrichum graminicola (strain M1.001 / M2 / FGSC 10212) TaxID=645133 RepID=E3QSV0_COLGM|nr:uncharacterized protein GLRG_09082 [Colletotrichum graminicola M1.001]EFQ33938.1 hypothetical protein GLRG_09082 [Colletotrichum graminicola M1.001]